MVYSYTRPVKKKDVPRPTLEESPFMYIYLSILVHLSPLLTRLSFSTSTPKKKVAPTKKKGTANSDEEDNFSDSVVVVPEPK